MVKSKKKTNRRGHFIKSKKLHGGSMYSNPGNRSLSGLQSGNLVFGADTIGKGLKSIEGLHSTTKQTSIIISALESPKWGTSKGASSYVKTKNNLMSIRRANIEAMENIVKVLGESSTSKQIKAVGLISELAGYIHSSRYQKILQNKREIESNFKNISVPRKNNKSEIYNAVSERVHIARTNALQDLVSLVRIETLNLRALLMTVVNDKGAKSLLSQDSDSSQ